MVSHYIPRNQFTIKLDQEQKDMVFEMTKWALEEKVVQTVDFENYSVSIRESDAATRFLYFNFMDALLFHIPRKLGMSFVRVDPLDEMSLYNTILERYEMYRQGEKARLKTHDEEYADTLNFGCDCG